MLLMNSKSVSLQFKGLTGVQCSLQHSRVNSLWPSAKHLVLVPVENDALFTSHSGKNVRLGYLRCELIVRISTYVVFCLKKLFVHIRSENVLPLNGMELIKALCASRVSAKQEMQQFLRQAK